MNQEQKELRAYREGFADFVNGFDAPCPKTTDECENPDCSEHDECFSPNEQALRKAWVRGYTDGRAALRVLLSTECARLGLPPGELGLLKGGAS